jgi:type VI secretion system protein ImpE
MNAQELFEAGKLSSAIDALNQEVRAAPTDARKRIFLFELLCFSGELQRAERQLDTLIQLRDEVGVEIGVQVYRNILEAEKNRIRIFKQGGEPKILPECPPYALLHIKALRELQENRAASAEAFLGESENSRSRLQGTINGMPFEDFRDCDDLIGPFLEVITHRDYFWIPFEQCKLIEIPSPARLRDLIWVPAKIELRQQPLGEVFLPVLYPGSSEASDDSLKLGRMTDWLPIAEEKVRGIGQKMFLANGEEQPLLESRSILFV